MFFGFIAAVVRPLISFITAVVAGIFCIGLIRDKDDETEPGAGADAHDHEHHDHGHEGHDHGAHEPLFPGSDDCYVSPSQIKTSLLVWRRRLADTLSRRRFPSWLKPDFYYEAADARRARANAAPPRGQPPNTILGIHRLNWGKSAISTTAINSGT